MRRLLQCLESYPSTFENEIIILRSKGYEPVFAKDIPEIINGNQKPEKKPVVLTMDDGYKDFYTNALPVIIRQKALDSGYVEVGSHIVHHTSLTNVSSKNAEYEIKESKRMLEEMFNTKVLPFAYPYGRSDKAIQCQVPRFSRTLSAYFSLN